MDKNIKQILTELYELEPSLQQHEAKLIKVVQKLLATKPNTRFDKAFAKQLRVQLLAGQSIMVPNSFNFNFMQKFGYLIGGAVIASVLFVPALLFDFKGSALPSGGDLALNTTPQFNILGDQAFGNFATQASGLTAEASADIAKSARPQSGGGGGFAGISMIAPGYYPEEYTVFDYQYVGQDFSLEQDKLEVLRKKTSLTAIGNLASRLTLGLLAPAKVSSLQFENVVMGTGNTQDVRVVTDFVNGEVFINQESGFAIYAEGEVYQPITPNEVPTDEELIAIANNFLKQFGVKTDQYGAPEILEANKKSVEQYSVDPQNTYISELFTVVYPLAVKGLPVYDQGGNKTGIMVNINLRTKQAVSVTGLALQNYDASLYPVNSNINDLIGSYENRWASPEGGQVKTVVVKLDTPELVFTTIYNFRDNQQERLLVPAYSFPIVEKPEEYQYFADRLIIPLVSGFGEDGPVRIMPLMGQTEPAVMIDPAVPDTTVTPTP